MGNGHAAAAMIDIYLIKEGMDIKVHPFFYY